MEGVSSPEKKPFWLFYLNDRIFPFGWAEQKGINPKLNKLIFLTFYLLFTGLPWRVMNLNANIKNATDSSLLLNVLKVNLY